MLKRATRLSLIGWSVFVISAEAAVTPLGHWQANDDAFSAGGITAVAPLADISGARVHVDLTCDTATIRLSGASLDVVVRSSVHTEVNLFSPNVAYSTQNRYISVKTKYSSEGSYKQGDVSGDNNHQFSLDLSLDPSRGDHFLIGFSVDGNAESVNFNLREPVVANFINGCEKSAQSEAQEDAKNKERAQAEIEAEIEADKKLIANLEEKAAKPGDPWDILDKQIQLVTLFRTGDGPGFLVHSSLIDCQKSYYWADKAEQTLRYLNDWLISKPYNSNSLTVSNYMKLGDKLHIAKNLGDCGSS
jgi:hypothetical protein